MKPKNIFSILILLLLCSSLSAQLDTAAIKQNIKAQSDSMFVAFKNQDLTVFSNYIHPDIIKLAKGKAAFISILEKEMKELEMLKFNQLMQVGTIQIVSLKKSIQCVVQYGLGMQIDSTEISSVSTSIGESTDNGKTWKFIRNNFKTFDAIKTMFPWVDNSLLIPKEEQKFGITLQDFLKTYKPIYIAKPKNTFAVRRTITTRKKKI